MATKAEKPVVERGRGRPRGHSGAAQREEVIAAVLAASGPLSRNDISRRMAVLHALESGNRTRLDEAVREAAYASAQTDAKLYREFSRNLLAALRPMLKDLSLEARGYLRDKPPAPLSQVYLAIDRLRRDGRVRKCADNAAGADTLWMLREQTCP